MGSSKPIFIPDTSVIIKWFITHEINSKHALQIKTDWSNEKIELLIPSLLFWEFNNFFGRKYSQDEAITYFSRLKTLQISQALLTLEMSLLSFKIMNELPKTSFYDASYHALAIAKKGIFITADKKYYKKAKSFNHIKLLSEY